MNIRLYDHINNEYIAIHNPYTFAATCDEIIAKSLAAKVDPDPPGLPDYWQKLKRQAQIAANIYEDGFPCYGTITFDTIHNKDITVGLTETDHYWKLYTGSLDTPQIIIELKPIGK